MYFKKADRLMFTVMGGWRWCEIVVVGGDGESLSEIQIERVRGWSVCEGGGEAEAREAEVWVGWVGGWE